MECSFQNVKSIHFPGTVNLEGLHFIFYISITTVHDLCNSVWRKERIKNDDLEMSGDDDFEMREVFNII